MTRRRTILVNRARELGFSKPYNIGSADYWQSKIDEWERLAERLHRDSGGAVDPTQFKIDSLRNLFTILDMPKANYYAINYTENQYEFNKKVTEERHRIGNQKYNGIKETYRFVNNINSLDDIKNAVASFHNEQNKAYKIQINFGVVTEKVGKEGEPFLWINARGNNGTFLFERDGFNYYLTVNNTQSFNDMMKLITLHNIMRSAMRIIKRSQVRILGVYNIQIKTIKIDIAMGNVPLDLPDYIKKNRHINSLMKVKNNMCFWACLAIHKGAQKDNTIKPAGRLFKHFYGIEANELYTGLNIMSELLAVENTFKISINIWEYNGERAKLVRESSCTYVDVMNLAQYQNHLMYITDIMKLSRSYKCGNCSMLFDSGFKFREHIQKCRAEVVDKFSKWGELYRPEDNIIIKIAKMLNVYEPNINFMYDYHAVIDYEAMLVKADSSRSTQCLDISTEHVPISASINSNVPGFGVKFFCKLDYSNTIEMNKAIYQYLHDIQEKAVSIMDEKIINLFGLERHMLYTAIGPTNLKKLLAYIEQLPVLTFNGGKYDFNLNKKHGLLSLMCKDGIQFSAKKANKYMAIATSRLKFLDITNYIAPGWTYKKYVKAFECELKKGYFPYEWLDDEQKLYATELPERDAFYSSLKSKNTLGSEQQKIDENYKMLQQIWADNNMKTMRDFLEWYNNLDVIPFVDAVTKQKQFYMDDELDMFKDAVSLPGLAEKVMFRRARIEALKKPMPPISESAYVSKETINTKIQGYMQQDNEANRTWESSYLDVATAYKLLNAANYRCHYCWNDISHFSLSFDRINCDKAHTCDNLVVACTNCNTARSDTGYYEYFWSSEIKRINKVSPQIHLISEQQKDVFKKLKDNVVGGASIIFHRYHEVGKTQIQRAEYDGYGNWNVKAGKEVKNIVGFDANALYLWCLGEVMPCGKLEEIDVTPNIIDDVMKDMLFGFAEVDIEVPRENYNKFAEFPPIFRNAEIKESMLGDYMKKLRENLGKPLDEKHKKLISSFTGEKILLYTPLLKWYIEHGLIVTKVHSFIKAVANKPFEAFTKLVSDNRRAGDEDKKKAILADTWKNNGNSAFGRTGMNKNRHEATTYTDNIYKATKKVNNWLFRDLNEIKMEDGSVVFEIMAGKKIVRQNCPLQVASAVYQLAKLRMLQFYYDCLDKFISRDDFQYVEMDTDSAYMAITGNNIEELIKPDMRDVWQDEKYNWFPDNRTKETMKRDKRTPGLFKVEWEGKGIVALTSKMYYCYTDSYEIKSKSSCKGVQMKKNAALLTFDNYKKVLMEERIIQARNKGIRTWDGQVFTYGQDKDGLTPIYDKRVVMADGVTTIPIIEPLNKTVCAIKSCVH